MNVAVAEVSEEIVTESDFTPAKVASPVYPARNPVPVNTI